MNRDHTNQSSTDAPGGYAVPSESSPGVYTSCVSISHGPLNIVPLNRYLYIIRGAVDRSSMSRVKRGLSQAEQTNFEGLGG